MFISVATRSPSTTPARRRHKGQRPPPPWHLGGLVVRHRPGLALRELQRRRGPQRRCSLDHEPVHRSRRPGAYLARRRFYGGIQTQMDSGERNPQVDGDLRHLPLLHGKMDHGHHLPAHGRAASALGLLYDLWTLKRAGRCKSIGGNCEQDEEKRSPWQVCLKGTKWSRYVAAFRAICTVTC